MVPGVHPLTDSRYMELIEMNAKLNAKLLKQSGGHVQAMVLDWINTDLDQFNTIRLVSIVANVYYQHVCHVLTKCCLL